MKTVSTWTCVNAIRGDTSSAVRWVWETRESTACQWCLWSLSSTQKDQTSQCVNPQMSQKQQGVSGLTHPGDDESTSRPNGWSSRHQCWKMQNITLDIHKEMSFICFFSMQWCAFILSSVVAAANLIFSSVKTMPSIRLLSPETSDPHALYLVLSPGSWEKSHVMMSSLLRSDSLNSFTIALKFMNTKKQITWQIWRSKWAESSYSTVDN